MGKVGAKAYMGTLPVDDFGRDFVNEVDGRLFHSIDDAQVVCKNQIKVFELGEFVDVCNLAQIDLTDTWGLHFYVQP